MHEASLPAITIRLVFKKQEVSVGSWEIVDLCTTKAARAECHVCNMARESSCAGRVKNSRRNPLENRQIDGRQSCVVKEDFE
jgi:hypothetical protein